MTIQPVLRDILFVSPTIISGDEDAVPYVSDVLVSGGRIASIGKNLAASHEGDARRIEAKGMVLSPGFIDLVGRSIPKPPLTLSARTFRPLPLDTPRAHSKDHARCHDRNCRPGW